MRERIPTPDDDFLDLDFARVGASRAVLLTHGLEGHSQRPYILGMVRAFSRRGWDAVVLNFRSCSGEMNRQARTYHGGATDDLHTTLSHVLASNPYDHLVLVGFSLGGNMILKYLGEKAEDLHPAIKRAAVFSVPTDFKTSAEHINRPANWIYQERFIRSLNQKARAKRQQYPGHIPPVKRLAPRTIVYFDDTFTAPVHGFQGADDYYHQVSSKRFIPHIRIPTLLVNAWDDPFLPKACYPVAEAEAHPYLTFETPASGGHVGFVTFNADHEYWSETRACAFAEAV